MTTKSKKQTSKKAANKKEANTKKKGGASKSAPGSSFKLLTDYTTQELKQRINASENFINANENPKGEMVFVVEGVRRFRSKCAKQLKKLEGE